MAMESIVKYGGKNNYKFAHTYKKNFVLKGGYLLAFVIVRDVESSYYVILILFLKILNYKILIILFLEYMRINFKYVNKNFNIFNKQIILFIK